MIKVRTLLAIDPLLQRAIAFLLVFIGLSGLIGPRIIADDILLRGGFEVYGGVGKAAIFGIVTFVLLRRHISGNTRLRLQPWQPVQAVWFAASLVCFAAAWYAVGLLIDGTITGGTLIVAHGGIILSVLCSALGCFGLSTLYVLWKAHRREICWAAGIAVAFYFFLIGVYALWRPLAWMVLHGTGGLLSITGLEATVIPPYTLALDTFSVTIAEYCSGVESIALFTSLYAVVGMLEWRRLRRKLYFIVFPFALVVLFLLNIGRVYALIASGYYINPEIAFGLFHTYAGLVFFIVYSALFWTIAYKHLVEQKDS
ncbi:MAG TPA: archaeosortase/exosortase family protein [Candidatus Saccharimonadales bacterium]|nr:archaeosortase/exosortase family protein [Candidatus Saccharimonadales bacterium]